MYFSWLSDLSRTTTVEEVKLYIYENSFGKEKQRQKAEYQNEKKTSKFNSPKMQ